MRISTQEISKQRNLAKVNASNESEAKRLMKEIYGDQVSLPTIRQSKPGIWRANWSLKYKKDRRAKRNPEKMEMHNGKEERA